MELSLSAIEMVSSHQQLTMQLESELEIMLDLETELEMDLERELEWVSMSVQQLEIL
jgi:hypothetical protein